MPTDLEILLKAWLGGEVNENELKVAIEHLKSDSTFRAEFVSEIAMLSNLRVVQSREPRWLALEDVIEASLAENGIDDFESTLMHRIQSENKRTRLKFHWSYGLGIAMLLLISFYIGHSFLSQNQSVEIMNEATTQNNSNNKHAEPSSDKDSFAILKEAVNVVWDGDFQPQLGDSIGQNTLKFHSGVIQLDFNACAYLMLKGPAEIHVLDPTKVYLTQGSAVCEVKPNGRGFRIATEEWEVIDTGTKFSIDVNTLAPPKVHVLEGSVIVESDQISQEFFTGETVSLKKQSLSEIPYNKASFTDFSDLYQAKEDYANQRYEEWKNFSMKISRDPSVLLHYTFEDNGPSPRHLLNQSEYALPDTDGNVLGCQWVPGRWPSSTKRGLKYLYEQDRVLFQLPGFYEQVSFVVWAKIDALTQNTTSLIMTEAPTRHMRFAPQVSRTLLDAINRRNISSVQTVRWELVQLTNTVQFNVGYHVEDSNNWKYDRLITPLSVLNSNRWGRWSCLAVSCDTKTGQVIQFLNGEEIGRGRLESDAPLLLDYLELGNFGASKEQLQRSEGSSQRRFYGTIDEVIIANRILTPAELREIWDVGHP